MLIIQEIYKFNIKSKEATFILNQKIVRKKKLAGLRIKKLE